MFQSRLFPLFSHIGKGNDEIEHNSRSLVVLHADENHHSTEHQHQQQEVEDGSVSHVPSEEDLELIKVQVIARHGARTPLTPLPRDGLDAYEWYCGPFYSSSNPNVIAPATADGDGSSSDASAFAYRTVSLPSKLRGDCIMGQLTIKGMQQMYNLGQRFSEKYVDLHNRGTKLLNASDFVGESDKIYVRSTDVTSRRTEMSAIYFMMGFVPQMMRDRYRLTVDLAERSRETMYPHERSCKRLRTLVAQNRAKNQAFRETEQVALYELNLRKRFGLVTDEEYEQQLAFLTQKHRPPQEVIPFDGADAGGDVVLADVADEVPTPPAKGAATDNPADAERLKESQKFNVERLHNTLQCIDFDAKPLPADLTKQDLELVHKFMNEYARNRFDGKELTRLAIGRFIGELLQAQRSTIAMHDQFDSSGTDALVIPPSQRTFEGYFAHDTTLIPIAKAFDNYYEWPPFASTIVLELYKARNDALAAATAAAASSSMANDTSMTKNDYYVKFIYNDQPMSIPDCDKILSDTGRSAFSEQKLYPFDVWHRVALERVPDDYAKECAFCPDTDSKGE